DPNARVWRRRNLVRRRVGAQGRPVFTGRPAGFERRAVSRVGATAGSSSSDRGGFSTARQASRGTPGSDIPVALLLLVRLHFGDVLVIPLAQDRGRDDRVGVFLVRERWIAALQLRQHVDPLDHAAKYGVATVEMRGRDEGEKELRAAG